MRSRLITVLFLLALSSTAFSQIQQIPDSSAVTGVGTVFEITNSDFVNVTVESSNNVFAYVQSFEQQITINIAKPAPEILSTSLMVRNLAPETTYTLIKNGRVEEIVTDESGAYACEVDLSLPQKMIITAKQ